MGLMDYVVFNPFASSFTFQFTLLDRISLVDATYNDTIYGINVEQSGAMHSSEPQTTEPNPTQGHIAMVEASGCTGYAPRVSSSQTTSACVCYSYRT
jgi:hypothetical protein